MIRERGQKGILLQKIRNIRKGAFFPYLQAKRKTITGKRMPLCLRASMTVEAAFVLPMFLFALLNLISIIEIYRQQSNVSATLYAQAKQMAVYSQQEYIDLSQEYEVEPLVGIMGFARFGMYNRMRTKTWTGYDNTAAGKDGLSEEMLVYVTPNGMVYHMSPACSYLRLSIKPVEINAVEGMRNCDGAKYYACESCATEEKNVVFITDYGNRYHITLSCNGLKRTVQQVPISQVGNRTRCSKCGEY